jgi:low temperature requirement protein LtrA
MPYVYPGRTNEIAMIRLVVVMLLLIWWIYDGYAWLTNAIATDRLRFRLLLFGGMGGFLLIALAAPHAYEHDGVAFGIGYLAVLVLAGGELGGDVQTILWASTGVMLWVSPQFTDVGGLVVGVSHFVERHGLVVIVVIGVGAEGLELDPGLVLAALLGLALNAALWWIYFSDETAVEEGFEAAPPERRTRLALVAFGYWHYGILLAVIAIAAGLKQAIAHPYDPLEDWIAVGLALYLF